MGTNLSVVEDEIRRAMDFARDVFLYFVDTYYKEILAGRGTLTKFITNPFGNPETTIKSLREFEKDTMRVHNHIGILLNTLRSRIVSLNSNFNVSSVADENAELDIDYREIIKQANELKAERIQYFITIASIIEKLKDKLKEELAVAGRLETHEDLVEHLKEANNLVNIFEKGEIPLHKELIQSFFLESSTTEKTMRAIEMKARQVFSLLEHELQGLAGDLQRVPTTRGKIVMGTMMAISLCKSVVTFEASSILNYAAQKGLDRIGIKIGKSIVSNPQILSELSNWGQKLLAQYVKIGLVTA